jgi:hypothetical protein
VDHAKGSDSGFNPLPFPLPLPSPMQMSWQNYVDDQLVGSGNITQAAILGHDGNNWAITKGWSLKPGEGAKVVAAFKDPASVFAAGILIDGVKYLGIKADARSIYGTPYPSPLLLEEDSLLHRLFAVFIQPCCITHSHQSLSM